MTARGAGLAIREDDPAAAHARELVALHLAAMRANSPPGAVFAFDVAALMGEGVTFWTAWRDGAAVGMAALKRLDAADAELKSMRTHPAHLRQGIAGALLAHVVAAARARG
ncbi:MAG: GNAT family N-acetyltransferase, partial [Hyphomicrobiales bacterium]|nr:GNAT family N-acetyltransferase [Hyphomicrobiales bacterium]